MPKTTVRENAFPVGLFIIVGMLLLVGGVLWLRDFSLQPKYTFVVTYMHPTRLISGYPIYYRGIQVGRIYKVGLASDLNSTNVTMGISKADLHLSRTVKIYTREETISGQRYIDIVPQDDIAQGNEYIHNGDKLTGIEPLNWDKFQEQLSRIAENRGFEKLVNSANQAMVSLTVASDQMMGLGLDARQFLNNTEGPTTQALIQFTEASRQVSAVAGDVRQFTKSANGQINDALPKMVASFQKLGDNTENAPQALDAIGRAADRADETLNTLNKQLVQSNLLPNLSHTISGLNNVIGTNGAEVHLFSPRQMVGFASQMALFEDAAKHVRESLIDYRTPDPANADNTLDLEQLGAFAEAAAQKAHVTQLQLAQALKTHQPPADIQQQMDEMQALADETVLLVQQAQPQLASDHVSDEISQAVRSLGATAQSLSSHIRQWESFAPVDKTASKTTAFSGIGSLFQNISQTAARLNCTTAQANHIMGKRFPGLHLLFGKPGAGYDCDEIDLSPKTTPEKKVAESTRTF